MADVFVCGTIFRLLCKWRPGFIVSIIDQSSKKKHSTERPRTEHHRRQKLSRLTHRNRNRVSRGPSWRQQCQLQHRASNPNHPGTDSRHQRHRQIGSTISLDSLEMACATCCVHSDIAPRRQQRNDSPSTHLRHGILSTDCSIWRTSPLQTTKDCKTAAETCCQLVGRLLLWFQDGRTHREEQCSSGTASRCSVATQERALEPGYAVGCTMLKEIITDRNIIWRINFRLQTQIPGF